jgi:peptide/nickel transport system ATP-binding protein
MDIQRKNKTTMLFISHDLSVVRYIADRVVVMYLGHIVEQGTTDQIFNPPYHPYTEALLSAIPIADTSVVKTHIVLEGDIPSAMNPPSGCPFQTRCRWKKFVPGNKCETELPPLRDLGAGHRSLCWLDDAQLAKMEPVIRFDRDGAFKPHDPEPIDPPHGVGPGFAGEPPKRPRGKRGDAGAGEIGAEAEESEHAAQARRHEVRDEVSETGAPASDRNSTLEPFTPRTVGDGRQAEDEDTPPLAPKAARERTPRGAASPTAPAAKRAPASRTPARPAEPAPFRPTPEQLAGRRGAVDSRPRPAASPKPAAATGRLPASPAGPSDRYRPAGMARPAQPDDLKLISGVGPKIERVLNELGIYRFEQVAGWKKRERDWVDGYLRFQGRIERDDWVRQAKALAKGGEAEYVRVFGKKPR